MRGASYPVEVNNKRGACLGRASVWLAALWLCGIAAAQEIPGYPNSVEGYDPREVAMLPGYCKYTQLFRDRVPGGNNPTEIAHWYQVMGHAFHGMHHYCWGLMKTNRALLLARTRQVRTYYLRSAVREFDYVINSSPPDFFMLPEIYTKRGENLLKLNEIGEAIVSFERAIHLKADYWPPYVALSDYFKRTGDYRRASEWLEKGLAASPDAKPLKDRMSELKAKPALPAGDSAAREQ
jgi:tetratricopeptide (TPR) repeat protein